MAEFHTCSLFSPQFFCVSLQVCWPCYILCKGYQGSVYRQEGRRRGAVSVSVDVKALWAPGSPPGSPILITDSNPWSTDANRVVFKLFGKKVVELTIEMHMNHFFECMRTGYCCNTAFCVSQCLRAWCPTCSSCCYCHPPWQQLNAEAGASPAHWKGCSCGAQKNSCTEKNYLSCYRTWIFLEEKIL